jgi:hypothetical protein
VNFCHPATSDNGDPGRTPARGQVCEWGPAAPLGNSRNTSHRAVVLPLPSVGAAPIHLEWFTPIHQDYPRAGERHVDIFPHRNSRFPTPHQCVSETHTVPPVPPHATAIAPTPQAVPVTAIRDPLQLAFTPDRHPSDSLHPHTLTEKTIPVITPI